MTDKPLVSVVIPVYNCEKYLGAAIKSVLVQNYQSWEIIVVDDGSTDGSSKIARSFAKVKYSPIEHSGLATALNHGISLCQGDYIAFLDSDDLWLEEKLTKQMAAFEANSELEAVFGHIEQFKSPELDLASKDSIRIPQKIIPGYFKTIMLVRRTTFDKIGLFDEHFRVGDFVDWYLRATEKGLKSLMLKEILAKRRIHKTNMGIRQREDRKDYARILKASLDRRRQLGKIKSSRLK